MNRKTLARPYAKAVFSYALERNDLNRFSKILKTLKLLSSDEDIIRIYKDSSISKDSLIEIILGSLLNIISTLSNTERKYLRSFIELLVRNKRFQLLNEIENLYDHYLTLKKNILPVEVVSARKLNEEQRYSVQDFLQEKFSKNISARYRVDETLVGGFLVRSSEWTLDWTVKEKLRHLTKILSK